MGMFFSRNRKEYKILGSLESHLKISLNCNGVENVTFSAPLKSNFAKCGSKLRFTIHVFQNLKNSLFCPKATNTNRKETEAEGPITVFTTNINASCFKERRSKFVPKYLGLSG